MKRSVSGLGRGNGPTSRDAERSLFCFSLYLNLFKASKQRNDAEEQKQCELASVWPFLPQPAHSSLWRGCLRDSKPLSLPFHIHFMAPCLLRFDCPSRPPPGSCRFTVALLPPVLLPPYTDASSPPSCLAPAVSCSDGALGPRTKGGMKGRKKN